MAASEASLLVRRTIAMSRRSWSFSAWKEVPSEAKCLCNALMADIGYGQVRDDEEVEKPLLTSGDDLQSIQRFAAGRMEYSAADVIDYLLGGLAGTDLEARALELQTAGK